MKKLEEKSLLKGGKYTGEIPTFYVKKAAESVSVYVGEESVYLFSGKNLKEVGKMLSELFELKEKSEKDFWKEVIKRYVPVPTQIMRSSKKGFSMSRETRDPDSEESWFKGAWFMGTFELFEKYPHLEVYGELPYKLIREVVNEPLEAARLAAEKKKMKEEGIDLRIPKSQKDYLIPKEEKAPKITKLSKLDKIRKRKAALAKGKTKEEVIEEPVAAVKRKKRKSKSTLTKLRERKKGKE